MGLLARATGERTDGPLTRRFWPIMRARDLKPVETGLVDAARPRRAAMARRSTSAKRR